MSKTFSNKNSNHRPVREQQPLPTGVARQLSEKGAYASGDRRQKAPKEMTSVKRNLPSNRIINKYYCENNILQIIGNRKRPLLGTKVKLKFKIINKESEREDWQNPGGHKFLFQQKAKFKYNHRQTPGLEDPSPHRVLHPKQKAKPLHFLSVPITHLLKFR